MATPPPPHGSVNGYPSSLLPPGLWRLMGSEIKYITLNSKGQKSAFYIDCWRSTRWYKAGTDDKGTESWDLRNGFTIDLNLDSSFPSSLIQLRNANSLNMERLILMYFMEINKISCCWATNLKRFRKQKYSSFRLNYNENNKVIAKNMKPWGYTNALGFGPDYW
jgi:hypothetical protein